VCRSGAGNTNLTQPPKPRFQNFPNSWHGVAKATSPGAKLVGKAVFDVGSGSGAFRDRGARGERPKDDNDFNCA